MEFDEFIPENILYTDGGSLKTANQSGSFLITGNATSAWYAEGSLPDAIYSSITGFLQWTASTTFVVDYGNHCVRTINRADNTTETLAGKCTQSSNAQGFRNPYSIIRNQWNKNSVLISDCYNHAIKEYDVINGELRVWLSIGMRFPLGMAFTPSLEKLVVASEFSLKVVAKNMTVEVVTGNSMKGSDSGSLATSKYDYIYEIAVPTDQHIIITECGNSDTKLYQHRVVDLARGESYELLNAKTNASLEWLVKPRSLLLKGDELYFGQEKSVNAFKCK